MALGHLLLTPCLCHFPFPVGLWARRAGQGLLQGWNTAVCPKPTGLSSGGRGLIIPHMLAPDPEN